VIKLAHIINPVAVSPSSNLFVAQPITFETMRIARAFAQGTVNVELFSAQYAEDRSIIPDNFQITPDLDRSILDVGVFQKSRKLPLIKDILDRLYAATDAEYLIYSNVDIAVMPSFYGTIASLIQQGYDALIINRRNIPETYQFLQEIPLMYAEVGSNHGGHDCFVFRREVYPKYDLGLGCIGAQRIGKILLFNLIVHAQKFYEFRDFHLTFHIGNDRVWKAPELTDYYDHNEGELSRIFKHYAASHPLPNHPQIQKMIDRYLAPDHPSDHPPDQPPDHPPDHPAVEPRGSIGEETY
jgi:hypothetical protein